MSKEDKTKKKNDSIIRNLVDFIVNKETNDSKTKSDWEKKRDAYKKKVGRQ